MDHLYFTVTCRDELVNEKNDKLFLTANSQIFIKTETRIHQNKVLYKTHQLSRSKHVQLGK